MEPRKLYGVHVPDDEMVERGRAFIRRDAYLVLLALILLMILATAFRDAGPWGLELSVFLSSATLLVALATSAAKPRTIKLAAIGCAIAFACTIAGGVVGGTLGAIIAAPILLVIAAMTPFIIANRLFRHTKVTIQTILGAVCIYLLVALLYSIAYRLFTLGGQPFFADSGRPIYSSDYVYYSFVTITTVGYGDLTAASQFGRMFSITEAIIGQVYLVTIVALLVGSFGREKTESAPEDTLVELAAERREIAEGEPVD